MLSRFKDISTGALLAIAVMPAPAAGQPSGFSLRPVVAPGLCKTWGDVAYGLFPAYGTQLMAGVDAGYRIGKQLELGTGLSYSQYKIRYCKPGQTSKSGDYDTIGRQQLSYLQVPLSLRHYTKAHRKLSSVGLLEIGIIYNILLTAQTSEEIRYPRKLIRSEASNIRELNSGGFSLLLSPGWSIPATDRIAVDLSLSGIIGLSPLGGKHIDSPDTGNGAQRRFPNVAFPTTIALVRFGLRIAL